MAVHVDILDEIGLGRGAAPMTAGQMRKRISWYQRREWHPLLREKDPEGYTAWRVEMMPTVAQAEANFAFNHRLAAYRAAVARLARYCLADGRPEITEAVETGAFDGDGAVITEMVVTQPEITALPEQIKQPVFDPETGAQTGTEMIANPRVAADDAERAAAQAVIDATPQEVIGFDA